MQHFALRLIGKPWAFKSWFKKKGLCCICLARLEYKAWYTHKGLVGFCCAGDRRGALEELANQHREQGHARWRTDWLGHLGKASKPNVRPPAQRPDVNPNPAPIRVDDFEEGSAMKVWP